MMPLKRCSILRYMLFCLLFISQLANATIHKSPNDTREYQSFTLNNQLRVLVISDPDSTKAAASLDVNVGSGANPEDRPGLAHFLEHMLFLGTEKYPQAGDYQAFISAHGGNHNAYTAFENTNYFFDIAAQDLEPALDRFAQFFIAPLFSAEYVDRERHAVHSEYQSKLRDDARRIYAVSKSAFNPDHSYAQFAVGSLETLADHPGRSVRDDLITFYQRYYSANLMTLVILGPQPVAQLKALAEDKFAAVPNFHAAPYQNHAPLFTPGSLPRILHIETVKELRTLSLSFPLPSVQSHWRNKPLYYISSLIGYEGQGSLLSELKQRGWATALSASAGLDLPEGSTFQTNISLTPEGLAQVDQVTALFFRYIELLREQGVKGSLYQEERQLNEIQFRFQERSEPIHYVGQLARQLQQYPAEEVVRAPYLLEQLDAPLLQQLLADIKPDNMLMTLASKGLTTDRKDPWYNTSYRLYSPDAEALAAMSVVPGGNQLAIRSENPFIPVQLSIKSVAEEQAHPQIIAEQAGLTLWHHQDTSFQAPKANLFFSVMSERANQSALDAALASLYTRMVREQLNETLYDAYLAGLSTEIYPHLKGFSVRLSGYDEKLPLLLERVVTTLKQPQLDAVRFEMVKQQYTEQLRNTTKEKPFNQTINEIFQLLLPQWSAAQKLAVLESVTLAQLEAYTQTLLASTELRVLAHGNLTAQDARAMADHIARGLKGEPAGEAIAQTPVVRLPAGQSLTQTLALQHNDSAISIYFQGDDSALKTRAEFAVLSELLASPFYSRLRTEQQLGYVVFQTPLPLRRAPGMAFVVQSPVADPLTLEQHINQFMSEMREQMVSMDEVELERYKRSVISRIMKDENSLTERSARYWNEIDRDNADFLSREALAQSIAGLSVADIARCFSRLDQRRLTVRSFGLKHLQQVDATETARKCDTEISSLKQAGEFMPES